MISRIRKQTPLSLNARLLIIVILAVVSAMATAYIILRLSDRQDLAFLTGMLIGLSMACGLVVLLSRQLRLGLRALDNGLLNLADSDFSVTLAASGVIEIDSMIGGYNRLVDLLRRERQTIFQRELLLDTVIENSSMCVLIADQSDRIIFSNHVAHMLLHDGKGINGLSLSRLLNRHSESLAEVVEQERNGIFRLHDEGDGNLYHISCGRFVLNAQRHRLILIKEMTQEINRQEAVTWKKIIRVISHELNNSLAPISSMAHSGQLLLAKGKYDNLPDIFNTLAERADHLEQFVGRYADIAKLPIPNKASIDWQAFRKNLDIGYPFTLLGELPNQPGFFDAGQLQQVILNLLKNAAESESDPKDITLHIMQNQKGSTIEVADRGTGMPQPVLESALLPFYTTKTSGSGIGLPLCREIIEAHEGQLSLVDRVNGGLLVRVFLPGRDNKF